MKTDLSITFNVESDEEDMTIDDAMAAVDDAAFNNLMFTSNGLDTVDSVEVHVDGFGKCRVSIVEEDE